MPPPIWISILSVLISWTSVTSFNIQNNNILFTIVNHKKLRGYEEPFLRINNSWVANKPQHQWNRLLRSHHSNEDSTQREEERCEYQHQTKLESSNYEDNCPPTFRKKIELVKRRHIFTRISTATIASHHVLLTQAQHAMAAAPLTAGDADNLGARVERSLRKKTPKILRPDLKMDFAVLLMRSSYNAVDMLDCVAMDQFQKDFFLIRQAEYQPYTNNLGPGIVKQGDLTDPYYFDFISFAQYATIFREITVQPKVVFEEQKPIDVGENETQQFETEIIRRDTSILPDQLLPSKHEEMVGSAILDRLNEIFGTTPSAIPTIDPGSRPDAQILLSALKQMLNLFLINGFAYDGRVVLNVTGTSASSSATEFVITLESPATLWSGQALELKRATPTNDFILKTAKVLLSRAGVVIASSSVKYDNTKEISTIRIK